jgi:cyclohexyl-isocyanide hydratase
VLPDRVVDDGDIITARGVSSAIDAGLHVVERFAGVEARDRVATQMDYPYRWNV